MQQLPKTLKEYYEQEGIDYEEEKDKCVERLYEDLVVFLNALDWIEPTDDMKREFLTSLDFQPVFDMYMEKDKDKSAELYISQIQRIMDESLALGPEYGFIIDIIVEFFIDP